MRGFERIEYILYSFLGTPKNGTDSPQQQYNCPCCAQENGGVPDGKHNLEINLELGKYQCWKCGETHGTRGNLGKLIRQYGGKTLYEDYKREIDAIIKARLYDITAYSGISENYAKQESLKLPKTFRKINLNGYCKIQVKDYLESRGIGQDIVDKFHLGYTEWEAEDKSWSYRIIIPSYDEFGDLNFYVGRDYTNNPKCTKYKNAKTDKKEIIFQESLIDWDAPLYLCEGAIDCLFINNGLSLLGKRLMPDSLLYKTILKKANSDIVICLDSDTEISETKTIYKLLNRGRLLGKIKYIRLGNEDCPYKDFGEIYAAEGKKGIIKAIKLQKEFSESELLIDF